MGIVPGVVQTLRQEAEQPTHALQASRVLLASVALKGCKEVGGVDDEGALLRYVIWQNV